MSDEVRCPSGEFRCLDRQCGCFIGKFGLTGADD
ncbi:hypothetical protein W823_06790 [Williamsia sp. D3]|nr:hypothetical protein W823_06790 [Williamsia sp. D3]